MTEGSYLACRAKQLVIVLVPVGEADEAEGISENIKKLVSIFEEALLSEFACAMSYAFSVGVQCLKGMISFVFAFEFEL